MITPSFSLTATERVLPRMALDFTTASLDPRVTFTRTGNTATVTNSSGYVVPINADLPRFDYDAVTLACKGLLIEEQRINFLLQSEAFNAANWTKTRASVVTDAIVSPDGTLDGEKIVEDTSTNTHFISQPIASVNATYSFSVYVKAAERTVAYVGMSDGATALVGTYINLSTGSLTTAGGGSWTNVTAISTNTGNGWWRVVVTGTRGAGTATACNVYVASGVGVISYTGNGTSGIYVWGAQLELGAFGTSYVPTTTATVTRNADVATMTGTNFSEWFNASAGTFFINTNARNADVLLTAGTYTLSANATALKKYATTYTADPSATQLAFGKGTIKAVNYYKQALIAAELAAITA